MDDHASIAFLQWALPKLHMRWAGFRKVRQQVCKRIGRRLRTLQITDIAAYRAYLERHREEWKILDGMCRVTVSRFFRDRGVFSCLQSLVLPELVHRMDASGETMLRIWSAGCAAGEEAYSLTILWQLGVTHQMLAARSAIEIIATDSDERLLERAAGACYAYSSIKATPEDWRRQAFVENDGEFCLRPRFRQGVTFMCQDVRQETPAGIFDLILCRNLVFTYFDDAAQRQILARLERALCPEGLLIVGIHESLPKGCEGFTGWRPRLGIYRRQSKHDRD